MTAVVFFLAEMGDKTQLATVALGARYHTTVAVTTGTTAGMMLADGLAVFAGTTLTRVLPMADLRLIAALLFLAFGATAIGVARALLKRAARDEQRSLNPLSPYVSATCGRVNSGLSAAIHRLPTSCG